MTVYKELVVATGKYTNAQGEEKTRWSRIGRIMKSEKGYKMKIDTIPLEWNGWAEMVEPEQRNAQAAGGAAPAQKAAPVVSTAAEDLPF
jgi:hypothetical protein